MQSCLSRYLKKEYTLGEGIWCTLAFTKAYVTQVTLEYRRSQQQTVVTQTATQQVHKAATRTSPVRGNKAPTQANLLLAHQLHVMDFRNPMRTTASLRAAPAVSSSSTSGRDVYRLGILA